MRLTQRQAGVAFVILVSIGTTAILSFGILWTHHKLDEEFFIMWRPDFMHGCMISIPTGFILNPQIKKLVDHYTQSENNTQSVANQPNNKRFHNNNL
jgi:hypothetical protein